MKHGTIILNCDPIPEHRNHQKLYGKSILFFVNGLHFKILTIDFEMPTMTPCLFIAMDA
jgi:hypothetical protein